MLPRSGTATQQKAKVKRQKAKMLLELGAIYESRAFILGRAF
jgi:hypothetical protein